MNYKIINIIFIIIILIEFGIIERDTSKPIEKSIPTISTNESISINKVIMSLNYSNDLKILKISNDKEYYTIEVEIRGNKDEFVQKLDRLKDYSTVGYELHVKNGEIIGSFLLKSYI